MQPAESHLCRSTISIPDVAPGFFSVHAYTATLANRLPFPGVHSKKARECSRSARILRADFRNAPVCGNMRPDCGNMRPECGYGFCPIPPETRKAFEQNLKQLEAHIASPPVQSAAVVDPLDRMPEMRGGQAGKWLWGSETHKVPIKHGTPDPPALLIAFEADLESELGRFLFGLPMCRAQSRALCGSSDSGSGCFRISEVVVGLGVLSANTNMKHSGHLAHEPRLVLTYRHTNILCIYLCMHAYYTYIYIYRSIDMSIYIYVYAYICTDKLYNKYVCIPVCIYICMHACMHACMCVRMYVCIYVCMYNT